MGRPIGKKGLDLIKQFEGCRLAAYQDSVGVWTIGYGHTHGVTPGMKIDQAEAERLLSEDTQKFANAVDDHNIVSIPLSDEQRDALISFAYNTGEGNLRKLCKNKNANEIAESMLHYNKAGGKELAGLTRRRRAEHDLFCSNMTGGSGSSTKQYIYNGVNYSLVFDPDFYYAKHDNLAKAYGKEGDLLFTHFVSFGMKEGRQGCSSFDVNVYKERYNDLASDFGNDLPKYYIHYITKGKAEGRVGI